MKKEFMKYKHVYFIGIGGISMSGLAEILKNQGFVVSGSDLKQSKVTKHLESVGITVFQGHKTENVTSDIDLVVFTAAIKAENPELIAAKEMGIPIMDRAHLLGLIMQDFNESVAIAGTHGKTTTTSMTSEILLFAGLDPTITLGGILPSIQSNIKIGNSSYFVAEACEYFDSFLQFHPKVGIILNVEADHLDYFKTLENIYKSFHNFGKNVSSDGLLVVDASILDVENLVDGLDCKIEYFALGEQHNNAQWQAKNICHEKDGHSHFELHYEGNCLGKITLNVPGDHNIKNALAACAAATFLGVSYHDLANGLAFFGGTDRRFQKKGEKNGIAVVDDYAHHPTEIKATLAAAKGLHHNEIWCVFQPHTYSRTQYLFEEFVRAFSDADHIIIADTFAARETDNHAITSQKFADEIVAQGKDAYYVGDFAAIQQFLNTHLQKEDMLLTIGAGNVNEIGEAFLAD